jgi:hypothetical protein
MTPELPCVWRGQSWSEDNNLRRKLLYGAVLAAVAFNLTSHLIRYALPATTGFAVGIAPSTCSCHPPGDQTYVRLLKDGTVMVGPWTSIHVSKDGDMTVGPSAVQPNEAVAMLSEMYSTRSQRILYVSVDDDVSFQAVANIIDMTRELEHPPQRNPERHPMHVEVRLVTSGAIDSPCAPDCFNWVKHPLIVH